MMPSSNSMKVTLTAIYHQHKDEIWGLYFAPDGKTLLSSDGTILYGWTWDGQNWGYWKSFAISAIFPCFTPDGKSFAFRDIHNTIQIRSLHGSQTMTLHHPEQARTDGIFSTDGRWFFTFTFSGELMVWDLQTSHCTILSIEETQARKLFSSQWVKNHQSVPEPHCLQRMPDGKRFVFTGFSPEENVHIYTFNSVQLQVKKEKTLPIQGENELKVALDGSVLALISQGEVYLYELHEPFRLLARLRDMQGNGGYSLLAFAPDSCYLASSTTKGIVDIWSLSSLGRVASFAAHPNLTTNWSDAIGGLAWSAIGYIATGGASIFESNPDVSDYTVKFWKVA